MTPFLPIPVSVLLTQCKRLLSEVETHREKIAVEHAKLDRYEAAQLDRYEAAQKHGHDADPSNPPHGHPGHVCLDTGGPPRSYFEEHLLTALAICTNLDGYYTAMLSSLENLSSFVVLDPQALAVFYQRANLPPYPEIALPDDTATLPSPRVGTSIGDLRGQLFHMPRPKKPS